MKEYSVQFRYDHRRFGPEGRTLRVKATSISAAISRGTREFLLGLGRKERFDANKKLSVLALPVKEKSDASSETI